MNFRFSSRTLMWCVACLLAVAYIYFCINPAGIWKLACFYIFQARDLGRATELLAGHPVFYGPEMTGGGNLPGPFYYMLLAVPLLLSPGDGHAAWEWSIALGITGGVAGWIFLRSKVSEMAGILWVGMYAMGVYTARILILNVNISYLLLFVIAALINICQAFGAVEEKQKNRAFVWACFLLGLGLQLHFSIVVLLFAMLVMQVFHRRLALKPVTAKTLLVALAALFLPLMPYLIWRVFKMSGLELGQPTQFSGSAGSALPTLLLQLKNIAEVPFSAFFLRVVYTVLQHVPFPLLVLGAAYLVLRKSEKLNLAPLKLSAGYRYLKPALVCAACSLPSCAYFLFVAIGYRYAMPFCIAMIFIGAILLNHYLSSTKLARVFWALSIGILLVLWTHLVISGMPVGYLLSNMAVSVGAPLLFFVVSGRKRDWRLILGLGLALALSHVQKRATNFGQFSTGPTRMAINWQWVAIWKNIYQQTGWSFEDAIHRIYFVNAHMEQDPLPGYKTAIAAGRAGKIHDVPDGYFVSSLPLGGPDAIAWLESQPIQAEIKEGLKDGSITIGDYSGQTGPVVIPYHVTNDERLPKYFHDYGEGYARSSDEELLAKFGPRAGAEKLPENHYLFHWNECPEQDKYCEAGLFVGVERIRPQLLRIDVTVVGAALSQSSPWISPNWTERWNDPYIEVKCGPLLKRVVLAGSIGYSRDYAAMDPDYNFAYGNNSWLAPFRRSIEIPCASPISVIRAGRRSSTIEMVREVKELPARELTLTM